MENVSIAFLTSGHSFEDDRIMYHLASTLVRYTPVIISSTEEINTTINGINVDCFDGKLVNKKNKISLFANKLSLYQPSIIICSEPLPVIAANKYKREQQKRVSVIYDITEWYPSKKHIESNGLLLKLIKPLFLFFFEKVVSSKVDGFIFGEYYKSIPYRMLFPFKKFAFVTYYPDLKYVHYSAPNPKEGEICLGYTGRISNEKGINNFFDVVRVVSLQNPDLHIRVKLIGSFKKKQDIDDFERCIVGLEEVKIELFDFIPFLDFSKAIADIDILFDLRLDDFENNMCLPIKIFYYLLCGKPVVYSNLKQ